VPKPLQTPHPPLFTTLTQSPATLDWAARVGSTIVTLASDIDMVNGLFQAYADAAGRYGRQVGHGEWRPDGGVALCRFISVARRHEDAMVAAEQAMAFTADWLGEFGFFEAWRLPGQEGPVPRTLEQIIKAGGAIVGTPDEAGEQVQRLREQTGVEYLVFAACGGAVDHARMLEMIGEFGEHVIPSLTEPVAV